MDSNLLLAVVVGIVIQSVLLYLIVSAATKATIRYRTAWAEMRLLGEIAKKQGVDEAVVNDIIMKAK